jgi:dienelactone hydrolase
MKPFLIFLFATLTCASLQAQVPSTAAAGAFLVGERAVSFSDSSLATPNVSAHLFYPAVSAGTGTPVANGQFPVIVMGHGFNLDYLDYQQLCQHWASWGYWVVTPDVQNGFNVDHLEFARELAACLAYVLAEGNTMASPLYQHVIDQTGVIGHSMGGGAAALVPGVYPGIDAVSGLAAAETNPSAIAALGSYGGPYQVISGSEDNTAPEASNQVPMYTAATGIKQHVSITGGAHCKFTDGTTVCDFVSSAGSVTRDFQIYMAKKYSTAFFNYFLKNDADALHFLCGDSLAADVAAARITESHTVACAVARTPSMNPLLWEIYPNPAHTNLHVRGIRAATLYDGHGRRVQDYNFGEAMDGVISLAKLAPGMYWLQPDDGRTARPFIRE